MIISASYVVRAMFGGATVLSFLIAVIARNDPRWFVLAGVLGTIWWVWDILVIHVFGPAADWLMGMLTGEAAGERMVDLRPTLDDTVRLLESHLEQRASQQVCVNSAIRLEEIYRVVKKDPERARRVIETVRERFPDAPEWEKYEEAVRDGKGR